ncbi:porin [Lentibacter sp. XHP0401]|uniref:porin n=1 Tax=Lentibacter sp. XHP0401 TaxID=2984334 RepID=UPI0021E9089B|nr:porin [Lentibacter sp. XHP0401]MCV2892469.1 porin [Lentibacter sp. XHP0401]
MKKILFATTALVATASVAAADVTFGGYGRFGIIHSDNAGADGIAGNADDGTGAFGSGTDVTSRLRLIITATAESDAGVTFGAMTRIQQGEGQTGTTNGVRFFARSGGLEVGVGHIWGALENMPGQYPVDMGLTGLGYDYTPYVGDGYTSRGVGISGTNGIEVMYSAGDFAAHISASDTNDRIAAYGAYTFSGWTVALAVQDSNVATDTEWAASVGGTIGPVAVGLSYTENGVDGGRAVLSAGMDVGAATNVEFYYAKDDNDLLALTDDDSYGIDFNHDLGGGTSLRGGVVKRFNSATQADFGVRFNF